METYKTKSGDMWDSIAKEQMGSEKYMSLLVKTNENYSIVANYTSEELLEKGYTSSEIWSLPKITMYDEILIN